MITELGNLLTWIETHRWRLQPYIEGVDVEHRAIWGSEIIRNVTKAIKQGDPVAIDLGCSVIIADQKYPFGKIIKSNLSRALKRESRYITKTQRQGILRTICKLLNMEFTPRETEDYCRLVSKFPATEINDYVGLITPRTAAAERWVLYLKNAANTTLIVSSLTRNLGDSSSESNRIGHVRICGGMESNDCLYPEADVRPRWGLTSAELGR